MNMKVNLNKQLNGIELIFQEKPATEILTMLKENGFRWHRKKKLWYAKVTDERKAFVKELQKANTEIISVANNVSETPKKAKTKKQPINKYGVKVGDMFCDTWGYGQTNVDFYQVVDLKGSITVVLKPVKKNARMIGDMSYMVSPIKDDFLEGKYKTRFMTNGEETIQRRVKDNGNNNICAGSGYESLSLMSDITSEINETHYY